MVVVLVVLFVVLVVLFVGYNCYLSLISRAQFVGEARGQFVFASVETLWIRFSYWFHICGSDFHICFYLNFNLGFSS